MKTIKAGDVWQSQLAALQEMECNLKSLIKSAQETLNRVKTNGLDHNYSTSHDCYEYAAKVWKSSLRLSELKKLQWQLEGRDRDGKNINKGEEE
jgi:Tfp pilus assembly protein PilV